MRYYIEYSLQIISYVSSQLNIMTPNFLGYFAEEITLIIVANVAK